jgi:MerR family transcriptional regulator/heat shock protein HspR
MSPSIPSGWWRRCSTATPQTLRLYERHGLVEPSRSDGNVRLYSQADVELVNQIQTLTQQMGVNLAGVDLVLRMRRQMAEMVREHQAMIEKMRAETEARFKQALSELEAELAALRDQLAAQGRQGAMVRVPRSLAERTS